MKRLILFAAIPLVLIQILSAQQQSSVSSSTTPGVVNVFLESPVDSAKLQPYLKIIKNQPGSLEAAEAYLAIAKLQYNNHAYGAAILDFRRALDDYPRGTQSEETRYYLISSLMESHRYNEAIDEAKKSLSLYSQGKWADASHYLLAKAYYELAPSNGPGLDGLAITETNNVVAGYPNSKYADDALALQGQTYKRSQKYNQAIETFRTLARTTKDKAYRDRAQLEVGWLYTMKDQYEEAIAEFEKAISTANADSVKATAQYHIGFAHLKNGDFEKAKKAFHTLVDRYPSDKLDSFASFRIGYCLAELEKYTEALEQLAKTDAAYPDFEQRDLLLWYEAISHKGLDQLELMKLGATTDTTHSNDVNLSDFVSGYMVVLEKRLEHLGQAKTVLEEVVARYPKSALLNAAEDTHGQIEQTIKELEAEKERMSQELQNQGTSKQGASTQEPSKQGTAKQEPSK
jgi:outer membrane protein assembly factor BamD (BamD/ComL family)